MNKSTHFRALRALLAMTAGLACGLRSTGQTVLLGTYDGTTIPGDVSIAANTTATFINGSSFTGANAAIGSGGYLMWNQNGTLVAKAFSLGGGGNYGVIDVGAGNSLVLDGATSVTGQVYIIGNATAAITNQGTITHNAGTGYLYAPTFTNQGAITATGGSSLYVGFNNGETLTNASGGTITANGSGTNVYLHSLVNQGTVTAQNGGSLLFTGALTTPSLGNVQIGTGGGHAYINGGLDNTASTLVAPTGGTYELLGGTISNGTIGAGALAFTSSNGTLSNVAYTGNLNLSPGTYVTFTNGTAFSGSAATIGNSGALYWNQNGTLAGKAVTIGSAAGYGVIAVGAGDTLTLDSGTSLAGSVYLYGNTGATITNQGTITHTAGSGYIYAPDFINQGAITAGSNSTLFVGYNAGETMTNAAGGTITADGAGANLYVHSIANQGTLTAQNGGALYFSGATTTANLGTVQIGTGGGHTYINGAIDNTAATLNAPTGGTFELLGGTVSNGTIAPGALTFTSSNGTLSNVSYTGNLNLSAGTYVTFTNGTAFTGSAATIGTSGYLYWNQNGTLAGKTVTLGGAGGYGVIGVGSGNTLTLDSATSLTGSVYLYGGTGAAITNQGTISQVSGTGYIYAPTLVNQGAISAGPGASLFFGYNAGESTTNASGGTVTADGAGANVYVHNIANQGTLTAQNGGALYFSGATTTANLGTVQIGAGGGHAYLNGAVDNTADTLNAPAGGTYEMYGGTISNGTIAPGALAFTNANGTLSNVSYTGNLNLPVGTDVTFTNGTSFTGSAATIGTSGSLYWNQNGTLSGKAVTIGSAGGYGVIAVGSGNSLTLDSGTSLTGSVYLYGNTGSTIVNQGAITHTAGNGYIYAPTLTNQGTVTTGANSSLYFGYNVAETTTNAAGGSLTADGAAARLYFHNGANLGTVTAQNGGEVYFTGATTTANLGTVQIGTGGGHAYLNGILDNTAATLIGPTGGTYELYGGTINNGSIAAGALAFTNANGTLSNVSYGGNLAVPTGTFVTFTNGTSFTGAGATMGGNSFLYWNQNGTLAGKTIAMGGASAYGVIAVGSGDSLTIDSATSLSGDNYVYGNSGSTVTNQGAITQTNGTGYLYAPTLTNQGSITAGPNSSLFVGYNTGEVATNAAGGAITADGTAANIYLHNFVNQGTLTAQNGGALYFSGTTTTANLGNVQIGAGGGTAFLYGTLDNTAATLTAPTGGSYSLYTGAVNNGTVAPGAIAFTSAGGTLSNVVYTGNLDLLTNTSVTFANGTGFTGASATLGDYANLYWNQIGSIAGKSVTLGSASGYASIIVGANDSLTLDAATTVTGAPAIYGSTAASIVNQGVINQTTNTGYLYAPTFTNQGSINVGPSAYLYAGSTSAGYIFSNAAGASINVTGGTVNLQSALTNAGIINVQSGTFVTNGLLTNGVTGTIMGAGTINGSLAMAGGFLSPGNSLGTLTFVNTGFSVVAASTLNIEISGTGSDELLFQNPTTVVNIGAGLLTPNITLLSAPTPFTTYNIMVISSGGSGFSGYFVGMPVSGSAISATYLGTPYDFTVTYLANSISFQSVPEPGTTSLLGVGLALVAVRFWRRRRAA